MVPCGLRAGGSHHGDSDRLSTDSVIALSDGELVRLTYEYISRGWGDADDHDNTTDALYFLVAEAFERFAPQVEIAEVERSFRESCPDPEVFESSSSEMRSTHSSADKPPE